MSSQYPQSRIPKRASVQSGAPAGRTAATTEDVYQYAGGDFQEPTRMPTSARRYYPVSPARTPQAAPAPAKRNIHWLVFVGLTIFIMIAGWTGLNALGSFIQEKQDDFAYNFPRVSQADADVGHNGRASHFLCLNLHGTIQVIELQPGHPEAAKIYTVMVLPKDQDHVPCILDFTDINGDGKTDMLVHIGNVTEIPLYNNGTTFQSSPPK